MSINLRIILKNNLWLTDKYVRSENFDIHHKDPISGWKASEIESLIYQASQKTKAFHL